MPRKRKGEHIKEVEVTFKMKVIIRNDMSIYDLLEKETEYIAEPQSTNGCVVEMTFIGIKKI